MSDDGGRWASADARNWVEGRSKQKNREVHPHGASIRDSGLRRLLSVAENQYDPADRDGEMPALFEDTKLARMVRTNAATDTFARAVEDGDVSTVGWFVGSPDRTSDISGLRALESLQQLVSQPAFMSYIWAEPGSGKTDFSLLIAELWQRAHPDGELGSNIRTWKEKDRWISNYGELSEWMTADPEKALAGEATPKLFIFDEASSHAGGTGRDGYETRKKLGPMLFKIRKYGGSLVYIGHDGKDVHPTLRELATCIHKEGKKVAAVYDTVHERKGEGLKMKISGIPPTDFRYNDLEPTEWSWEDAGQVDPEVEAEVGRKVQAEIEEYDKREAERLRREGLSYRNIARKLDRPKSTIHDWVSNVDVDENQGTAEA